MLKQILGLLKELVAGFIYIKISIEKLKFWDYFISKNRNINKNSTYELN